MMHVLVCGGRDFRDRVLFDQALDPFRPTSPIPSLRNATIIHGGARGADALADEWAYLFGLSVKRYPADWKAHGKAAGPIRNQRMIDEGKPDIVIAFPGGRGTADMVKRARAAGIEVREIRRPG